MCSTYIGKDIDTQIDPWWSKSSSRRHLPTVVRSLPLGRTGFVLTDLENLRPHYGGR